jgi:glycogen debranching enzyme
VKIPVGPPTVTIFADDEVLVSEQSARISSQLEQGYFAADTRLVSGYRLWLGRAAPVLLNSSDVEHYSCRFEFVNAALHTESGLLPEGALHLRLDRTIDRGVHEDYDVVNHSGQTVDVDLDVSIWSEFGDIFEVKAGRRIRRGRLHSSWDEATATLRTTYRNGDFVRALRVQSAMCDEPMRFVNGRLHFRVVLAPGEVWHTCLFWLPEIDGRPTRADGRKCHDLIGEDERDQARRHWIRTVTSITTSEAEVSAVVQQAVADLASLRLHQHDEIARLAPGDETDLWIPAAGVPWFLSVFGRDALVVSMQTLALSPRFALGALAVLGALQGDGYDDARDMQPGKILHELRRGELATLGLVPHSPYYGTHEATTLFVWVAAEAWRWHGDREALDAMRPRVEAALAWIDRDGDIDGDGLLEYATRSPSGYYNQGWKDAGDAIVHADGSLAPLPIALCEHQGYVVAAKRAWASAIEEAYGEHSAARRLRAEADRVAELIEDRFWWDEEGTYFLGLDGDKRPIESVTSNPGHLLWAQAVSAERAASVAKRLLAPDMWSGWGIRTLSASHAAYNPFSYQRGSVWPHDNAICADGFRRYHLDEQAAQVVGSLFEAAAHFQSRRPPELFAGLQRSAGAFPVQYLGANVPQAWASGAVVQALVSLLGLHPDAARRRLVIDSALPAWLTRVDLSRVRIGDAVVDLTVCRDDKGQNVVDAQVIEGSLHLETRMR